MEVSGGDCQSYKEIHFVLAIVSQFLYCAGQIRIFSFFVNYMKERPF